MTSTSLPALSVSSSRASASRTAGAAPRSGRTGGAALAMSLAALACGTIGAGIVGFTVGPMEGEYGRMLGDTPAWYQAVVWGLLAANVLWTALGLAGLVTGVVAAVRGTGRWTGIAAILLALAGPALVYGVFMTGLLAGVGGI